MKPSTVPSHPRNPETMDDGARFFLRSANYDFGRAVECPEYVDTYLGRAAGMMAFAVARAETAAVLRGHKFSTLASEANWAGMAAE